MEGFSVLLLDDCWQSKGMLTGKWPIGPHITGEVYDLVDMIVAATRRWYTVYLCTRDMYYIYP